MSWSISYKNLRDLLDNKPDSAYGDPPADQLDAAQEAAGVILDSHSVGGADYDYRISLNGHSNPEHKPTSGMANDTITVTVSQIPREKEVK